VANAATTNGGTVLTVPAGKVWRGHICLAASLIVPIGGAAALDRPTVTVSGTGGSWSDTDVVLSLALSAPAVGATATVGCTTSSVACASDIGVEAGANDINLLLNFGAGVTAIASAIGIFF